MIPRLALVLATVTLLRGAAAHAADPAVRPVRKPKISWTLQVGLAHSARDDDHYAVSGIQGRFPVFALDRATGSDRWGGLGVEVGAYPYPVISRAYVPGPEADPETPGKHNFWEAVGASYYTPRLGPLQLEAGLRLAFVNPAERVLTSPNGCGVSNRTEAHCNAYIKESLKTLDTILFPSFRGGRGLVRFSAVALVVKGVGARVEWACLNGSGARTNACGLRFGLTGR
jgi:hypothetical protein